MRTVGLGLLLATVLYSHGLDYDESYKARFTRAIDSFLAQDRLCISHTNFTMPAIVARSRRRDLVILDYLVEVGFLFSEETALRRGRRGPKIPAMRFLLTPQGEKRYKLRLDGKDNVMGSFCYGHARVAQVTGFYEFERQLSEDPRRMVYVEYRYSLADAEVWVQVSRIRDTFSEIPAVFNSKTQPLPGEALLVLDRGQWVHEQQLIK